MLNQVEHEVTAMTVVGILSLLLVLSTPSWGQHAVIPVEKNASDSSSSAFSSSSSSSVFSATEEWQEVLPGQSVPAGLHVRMNLQTGRKEAKLLGKESAESITKLDDDPSSSSTSSGLRSFMELQKAVEEQKMRLNTEFEHISTLTQSFHDNFTTLSLDAKLNLLEDLDFYLHKLDNGLDFINDDGLNRVIKPALDDEDERMRRKGTLILAGCLQANPQVQEKLLSKGWLQSLLDRLQSEQSESVQSGLLHALSCFIRGHSRALHEFEKLEGFEILLDKLGNADFSLRLKTMTLIADTNNRLKNNNNGLRDKLCTMTVALIREADTSLYDNIEKLVHILDNLLRAVEDGSNDGTEESKSDINKLCWEDEERRNELIKFLDESQKLLEEDDDNDDYVIELRATLKRVRSTFSEGFKAKIEL